MTEENKFLTQSLTGHEIMTVLNNTPKVRYTDRYNDMLMFCHGDVYDNICKALEEKNDKSEILKTFSNHTMKAFYKYINGKCHRCELTEERSCNCD